METIELQTRAKIYGNLVIEAQEPSSSLNPSSPNDFHIERPAIDPFIRPPKGTLRRMTHNTSARASRNYNIVEYLAQAPSTMSILKVLQTCSMQRKALISVIGGIYP